MGVSPGTKILCVSPGSFPGTSGGMSQGSRPVLAIDFDEVCVGYLPAFVAFNNATHGTDVALGDFHSYMFWEVEGCKLASREAATSRVYEFHASDFFTQSIRPLPGAFEGLQRLADRYELHVVTSRQNDIEAQTHACISQYFPSLFAGVHFGNHFGKSGAKVSKPEMCARIGAVALVDDSLDYARQCAKAGMRTLLFGHYGWNQSGEELDPLITRVADWDAVVRQLLD